MSWAQLGLLLVIVVPVAVVLVMMGWPADGAVRVVDWAHATPRRRFTVTEAHHAMQQHRTCSVIDCPRKEAAQAVLITAGRMVPDPRRSY